MPNDQTAPPSPRPRNSALAALGPGILVAATGVGAADLATAGFAGAAIGLSVLWAVALGAAMKALVAEGLARYQIQTRTTILDGALDAFGHPLRIAFALYLLFWSWFVALALIKAAGVTLDDIAPLYTTEEGARTATPAGVFLWATITSITCLALVIRGGLPAVEKIMTVAVGVMVATSLAAAIATKPDPADIIQGFIVPTVPTAGENLRLTIALIGGVGGTVTILSYAYWMREQGRREPGHLKACRTDIALAYTMSALFGAAMVIIAAGITTPSDSETLGKGARLIINLADRVGDALGAPWRWVFLAGALAAMVSSILGVWQSVPYIWSDLLRSRRCKDEGHLTEAHDRLVIYRVALITIATVPIFGLQLDFKTAQIIYAVTGAFFVPLLAIVVLLLTRRKTMGSRPTGPFGSIALLGTILFFTVSGILMLAQRFAS